MSREPRHTLDLFAQRHSPLQECPGLDWPDPERFPLNLDSATVADVVQRDLHAAREPLIVTGYAGLDRVIGLVADCPATTPVRILFGSEPFPSRRESFELVDKNFSKEVESYWLKRGISLLLSAKLIQCIERLKSGRLATRYLGNSGTRLHAKIYCTEEAATVGSSNFTHPGMESQLEANARFTAKNDPARYRDLKTIAENYWQLGRDYNSELIELLDRLLRLVTWAEALARACAELLEGDWAQAYLRGEYLPEEGKLWPSQRQGIAQALYVLTRQGSVLIADATGSGKTRMGVHLIGAVADHNIRTGRMRRGKSLMVCPPAVSSAWEKESLFAGVHMDVYSHGVLSHTKSRKHELTLEALRRAQILSVDEGHNFLNMGSTRTQNLLRNMADHVMLFTATPINRSVVDLLRIADMLGADNLHDSTLEMFRKLLATKNLDRSLEDEEIEVLRKEIKRFTVRRTKRLLNRLIDREPELYVDKDGRRCRFPKHKPKTYKLHESAKDRELAAEIRVLADRLYAVTHFQNPIEMPEVLRRRGATEEHFLNGRLSSAKKIARFQIMKSLRSSRMALAEHIVGTVKATSDFGLVFHKHTATGDVLGRLEEIPGKLPINKLSIPLPAWLSDEAAHIEACAHDHAIYEKIYGLVRSMSDGREREKASFLLKLVEKENLVLAFDSRPITLAEIQRYICQQKADARIIIATGDPGSDREGVLETFALGSGEKTVIGLCSDSLAEGVNLQQAAALVHLDMPSVVRIAEQRVGRIDRLDSPHKSIEAWWPEDAEEFALSSDERFIERYETVDALLGSNLPLPEAMRSAEPKPVKAQELIKEYEKEMERGAWDGIQDAFEPIRALIDGPTALVDGETYEHYRKVTARVLSRVSLVKSDTPWAFFCLAGGEFNAPRWVFLPSFMGSPEAELGSVCNELRTRLTPETENLPMNDASADYLSRFLSRLAEAERMLLPARKQRALEEMETAVSSFMDDAMKVMDQAAVEKFKALQDALTRFEPDSQPDWDEVARQWMDLIRPIWYERLKEQRSRPLLLKDIRKDVLKQGPEFRRRVLGAFEQFPVMQRADERISACIIGVA